MKKWTRTHMYAYIYIRTKEISIQKYAHSAHLPTNSLTQEADGHVECLMGQ